MEFDTYSPAPYYYYQLTCRFYVDHLRLDLIRASVL